MAERHFYEQQKFAREYLIPYFERHIPNFKRLKILDIGCAEAGFIHALNEIGIDAVGVELAEQRVMLAREKNPQLTIYQADITDSRIADEIGETFDLIVMRDVIEHIPDRVATFINIGKLLNKNGYLYITFPPRFSGFAGHQQNGRSVLRFMPFLHLLPNFLIKTMGKIFNEKTVIIDSAIRNYRDGLTISAFEKYYSQFNFRPVVKELYLFRPIYKMRYNLSPRRFPNIPLLREFMAFGCECLLQKM